MSSSRATRLPSTHATTKEDSMATQPAEAILCVSAESRSAVDDLADAALAVRGAPTGDPMDHGFMYGRSFHDLDGHL